MDIDFTMNYQTFFSTCHIVKHLARFFSFEATYLLLASKSDFPNFSTSAVYHEIYT